jgi:hypothetical protein
MFGEKYKLRSSSLCSLTVAKEISKYNLDLMRVNEIKWDRGGTKPAGEYTFFYGKGSDNHESLTVFL